MQKVVIEHLGEIINGHKKDSNETPNWKGAKEIYSFQEVNGVTILNVEIDLTEDSIEYFNEKYPEALNKLKLMCEINNNG